jgi:electron transfer flavoprotein alpha subunit
MPTAYIYSEKIKLVSELVTLGKELDFASTMVIAFDSDQAARLADCGADGIVLLTGATDVPENNARPLAYWLKQQFATDPGLLIIGATPVGRDLAARTAGYLDCGLVSDILTAELVEDGIHTQRSQYGGAVVLSETLPFPAVLTVPAGRFEATSGAATVSETADLIPDTRLELLGTEAIVKDGIDLAQAKSVVGVGMGLSAYEDMALANTLANVLDAGIGCTRGIAEERHWLGTEQYLGLSGLTVSPNLYIAIGISGQVQHLVGVRDSKVIVAINKNEDAPIFKAADYGLVGDLYEIVPALTAALAPL